MPDRIYLRQMQALPLIAKVRMSQHRIREWYEHFDGNVFVSFSGGKDSTVLAHVVHDIYPDVPLVFCNTGLEYPEIRQFAERMGAETIYPKMSFAEVISKYGYPIISKENAEAIQYARRIIPNFDRVGGHKHTRAKRNEFLSRRYYEREKRSPEQESVQRPDGLETCSPYRTMSERKVVWGGVIQKAFSIRKNGCLSAVILSLRSLISAARS